MCITVIAHDERPPAIRHDNPILVIYAVSNHSHPHGNQQD
jgi:hypothetical protein